MLVERHPGSSPHPRAIGFTATTMEAYRAVGVAAHIPQVSPGHRLRRARVESLAGKRFDESEWTPQKEQSPRTSTAAEVLSYSPYTGAAIAQDRLEPMLREKATLLGADVRLDTEMVGFEQDAQGVTASLRDRDGREYQVRAAYLIAADGPASQVRQALGIGRKGRGHMRTVRSVLFRAPLEQYLKEGVHQFTIEQPGFDAFLTTYADGRWVLMFLDDVERDEPTLRSMLNKAIGRSDLEVEILTTGRWELSALIADRFSSDRVFLAGDAAHVLPPSRGGFGANTGIADAHNLSWKLAAVLSGASTPRLLDTYDAERRPIAWLRHQQIFARPDYRREAGETAGDVPIIDDDAMEFGQLYRSLAVIDAGEELPPAARPEQWSGQPGTRAPHVWLRGGHREADRVSADRQRSTLDLFGGGWVLLADDEQWCSAAVKATDQLGVALKCLRIRDDVRPTDPEAFRAAFGLSKGGASLVRPDGYVAWRALALPEHPFEALSDALGQVSSARGARS